MNSISLFRKFDCRVGTLLSRTYYFRKIKDGFGLTDIIKHKIRTRMDSLYLTPPSAVRGMQELDRTLFQKTVKIPTFLVAEEKLKESFSVLKKYVLKFEKLKPVNEVEGKDGDVKQKRIYLNPLLFKNYNQLSENEIEKLSSMGITEEKFENIDLQLNYENYKAEEVLKAVLPDDKEGCTSYSRIGHIIHLNLRDHLLPYKKLIGQVMIDKFHGIRTVINKSHTIDTTFRNFQFEILAGEPDLVTEVKESRCTFKFDFGQVYWNPRLSTEHERIVKLLPENGRFFDVFAGVGPFTVPAARLKKCKVYANDLNPHSFFWLKENCRVNKVTDQVEVFNQDGRDFIREKLPEFLKQDPEAEVHVAMNLPAVAITFLDAFIGILEEDDKASSVIVHLYSFCEETDAESQIKREAEKYLRSDLEGNVIEIVDVRDVSPKKHMMRISLRVPPAILMRREVPETKKIRLE